MKDYSEITDRAEREQAMLKDFKRMAKSADQKLRRLEKLAQEPNFKPATQWAYAGAMQDIKAAGGTNRFDVKPKLNADGTVNLSALKQRMADIENFMIKPTSNKRGIMAVYNERANTVKQKYGLDVKWSDMANFYESKLWSDANKQFGSKTASIILGKIQENGDEIKKLIQMSKRKHKTIPQMVDYVNKNNALFDDDLNNIAASGFKKAGDTKYTSNLDDEVFNFISKHKSQLSMLLD